VKLLKKTRFIGILILVLLLALVGCGGSEPPPQDDPAEDGEDLAALFEKGRQIEELSYEFYMDVSGMETEGKVWLKKNKMKVEMTVGGQTAITIIDGDAEEAYMYMPAENMAIRMPFTMDDDEMFEAPTDFLDYDESIMDVGETVILNGIECQKVSFKDESNITMWIHKEYGIPIRVEIEMEGETIVWEYRNISIAPIPDEVFKLPDGVNIIGS